MKATPKTQSTDLNHLIRLAATTHHPVRVPRSDGENDVIIMNQQDFETAREIIKLTLGRYVPFMIEHSETPTT